jgi:AcrR family transcriptional regulator
VTVKKRIPPRERILAAASDLFHRQGIRGVGVEAIAAAARTNKMALYRHFESKDALVAEWLRRLTGQAYAMWDQVAAAHPGDARAQLVAWFRMVAGKMGCPGERGCPFANALAELPDKGHPARRVIEAHKLRQRDRFAQLCRQAGIRKAEFVADELLFLLEGAQVSAQSFGPEGVGERLLRMAEALLAANAAEPKREINN